MTILRGLGFLYTGGYPIYDLPREFIQFGQGYFLGVPIPTIVLLAVAAAAHVTLRYTSFGRHVYAVGGNRDAALFSGVKVCLLYTSQIAPVFFGIAAEVDAIFERAVAAGASVQQKPVWKDWDGKPGYSGFIMDPDGYVWELAYAPALRTGEDNRLLPTTKAEACLLYPSRCV